MLVLKWSLMLKGCNGIVNSGLLNVAVSQKAHNRNFALA